MKQDTVQEAQLKKLKNFLNRLPVKTSVKTSNDGSTSSNVTVVVGKKEFNETLDSKILDRLKKSKNIISQFPVFDEIIELSQDQVFQNIWVVLKLTKKSILFENAVTNQKMSFYYKNDISSMKENLSTLEWSDLINPKNNTLLDQKTWRKEY